MVFIILKIYLIISYPRRKRRLSVPVCIIGDKIKACKRVKVLLFKQIIRPIMTYGAPLFVGASKKLITTLQRLKNKILPHIANVDRYVRIRRLYLRSTTHGTIIS